MQGFPRRKIDELFIRENEAGRSVYGEEKLDRPNRYWASLRVPDSVGDNQVLFLTTDNVRTERHETYQHNVGDTVHIEHVHSVHLGVV